MEPDADSALSAPTIAEKITAEAYEQSMRDSEHWRGEPGHPCPIVREPGRPPKLASHCSGAAGRPTAAAWAKGEGERGVAPGVALVHAGGAPQPASHHDRAGTCPRRHPRRVALGRARSVRVMLIEMIDSKERCAPRRRRRKHAAALHSASPPNARPGCRRDVVACRRLQVCRQEDLPEHMARTRGPRRARGGAPPLAAPPAHHRASGPLGAPSTLRASPPGRPTSPAPPSAALAPLTKCWPVRPLRGILARSSWATHCTSSWSTARRHAAAGDGRRERRTSASTRRRSSTGSLQTAMALSFVHEMKILHRDIKTSNVFLTKRNMVTKTLGSRARWMTRPTLRRVRAALSRRPLCHAPRPSPRSCPASYPPPPASLLAPGSFSLAPRVRQPPSARPTTSPRGDRGAAVQCALGRLGAGRALYQMVAFRYPFEVECATSHSRRRRAPAPPPAVARSHHRPVAARGPLTRRRRPLVPSQRCLPSPSRSSAGRSPCCPTTRHTTCSS